MTGIQRVVTTTGSVGGGGMLLGLSIGEIQGWLGIVSASLFMLSGLIYLLFMFSKWKGFKAITAAELAAKDADIAAKQADIEASQAEKEHWEKKAKNND